MLFANHYNNEYTLHYRTANNSIPVTFWNIAGSIAIKGDNVMSTSAFLNDITLDKHVSWLEHEIGLCLDYDLPTDYLERELSALREIQRVMMSTSVGTAL